MAAALLLHLPAHFAPGSTAGKRELLPEDHPAFVGNPALAGADGEGVVAAARRAAVDPSAQWLDGADTVGRARWRPVATTFFVAERAAPWADSSEGAAAGAALVSLALHVLVALGAARLATSLGGDVRAATVAGLLAAASPVALSAAAWPARQSVVIAAALALAGALVALRGGALRLFIGGVLLAFAGLAHEAAFGWVLAVPLLRRASMNATWKSAWPCIVAPAAAFAARCVVLGGLGLSGDGAAVGGAFDGVTGVVDAFVSFALPARMHFADGPFAFGAAGRAVGLVALAAGVVFLSLRVARPAAASALAAAAALTPLVFVGAAGGAPYQDSSLYLVLPILAASAGLLFSECASRGGATRTASAAAAAMLLAASVAATSARAASFRTKSALVALAKSDMPESLVVRTWDVASRAGADPRAVAADVRALAGDVDAAAPRLRADAAASATISAFFSNYASAVMASSAPLHDSVFDAAEAAASSAAELRPRSVRTWLVLASLRNRTGALRGAFEAALQATNLAPDDVVALRTIADIALAVGDSRFAADTMERAMTIVRSDPRRYPLDDEFVIFYARTYAADGAWRVPDVASDYGLRFRYDVAAEALESLMQKTPPPAGVRGLLYDVYLRYGDTLATLDRTAMALIAYEKAFDLTGRDEKQAAAQHRQWLLARLEKEAVAAKAHLDKAEKEPGTPDIGNALADMYVVLCRENLTAEADGLFAKLEHDIGSIPPALRFHRAVQRFAAREDTEDQQTAEVELRQVLRDDPTIARARYELARVLEWQGTIPKLRDAQTWYAQAARDGAAEDWSLDSAARADAIEAYLASWAAGGGGG